jgi:uncharacterized protein
MVAKRSPLDSPIPVEPLPAYAWLPPGVVQPKASAPISGFLLKIASRCNLACPYCYVYNSPDKSWEHRPKFMSAAIVSMIAARISEHVVRHKLERVYITFHGGEPLLAGASRLASYIEILKTTIPAQVSFGMQTNGTLLTPTILNVLSSVGSSVGISLDGDEASHDRNRYFVSGNGSYFKVRKGIELIKSKPEWARMFSGVLVVVDLKNDPISIYEELVRLKVPSVDFLLPDAHHDAPPPRSNQGQRYPAYGTWLSAVFNRWYDGSSANYFSWKL